jgi:parvulin-like peptidyl-prolyl isomerase
MPEISSTKSGRESCGGISAPCSHAERVRSFQRPRSAAAALFGVLAASISGVVLVGIGCAGGPPRNTPRATDADATVGLDADARARLAASTDGSRVVARVNDEPLTQDQFFSRLLEKAGANTTRMEIVFDELVRQEAARRGIEIRDDEVETACESVLEGMAGDRGMAELEAEFSSRGLPLAAFRADLGPQVRRELLRRKVTQARRTIGDEELRRHYEATYKRKRFVVRHIAIGFLAGPGEDAGDSGARKLDAFERSRRVVDRVRAGHDFVTIARAESDDKLTAPQGGLLPAISEESPMPPTFKEAIFALEPGQVSEPVENPDRPAFHVFQLVEILPSQSYVDCVEAMKKELAEREPDANEISGTLAALARAARVEWVD